MSNDADKAEQPDSPPPSANPGKTMRNIVWITCGIALVLVNIIAEVGERLTGIEVHMFLRISLVVGVTFGVTVLAGAGVLVSKLGDERSLSGNVRDTLGADRKKSRR